MKSPRVESLAENYPAGHHGRYNLMKKPISLVLVTGVNCDVGCKTCPAGRKEEQPSGWMKTEMAEQIIKKACAEARVLSVCLYYFNEPFLLPNIVDLVKLCHSYGKNVLLSSNLVRFKNGPEVLALEPFNLIVSVSGWSQAVYERSHAGGDVEKVKDNMRRISVFKKPGTSVRVSWHSYNYNRHEEPLMREFARSLGFTFTPYCTGLLPLEAVEARWAGETEPTRAEEDVVTPVLKAKILCEQRKRWACHLQNQTLVVDSNGMVLNCGTRNNAGNLRGSFFDKSVKEIMEARQSDPMCVSCKAKGLHIYGQQAYTIPRHSFVRWVTDAYKATGLQGLVPRLTTLGVRTFYQRPQKELAQKEVNLED